MGVQRCGDGERGGRDPTAARRMHPCRMNTCWIATEIDNILHMQTATLWRVHRNRSVPHNRWLTPEAAETKEPRSDPKAGGSGARKNRRPFIHTGRDPQHTNITQSQHHLSRLIVINVIPRKGGLLTATIIMTIAVAPKNKQPLSMARW